MSPKSIDPVTQLVPGEWDRGITLIADIWVDANPSIRVFIIPGRRNLSARSGPFISLLTYFEKRYKLPILVLSVFCSGCAHRQGSV